MRMRIEYVNGGNHPIAGPTLFRVSSILESLERERYQLYLANALDCLTPDIKSCDRILSAIELVEKERIDGLSYDGDEVQLEIHPDYIQVDIAPNPAWVGTREGRIETAYWKAALEGKKRFLAMKECLESAVEVDFSGLD